MRTGQSGSDVSEQVTASDKGDRPRAPARQVTPRIRPAGTRDGFVDFYGAASIGWVACGWVTADWDGSLGNPEVELRFADETVSGQAIMVLYQRADVGSIGLGYVIMLPVEPWAVAELLQVTLHSPQGNFNLYLSNPVERLGDNTLLDRTRSVLEHGVVAGNKSNVFALLARSAYAGENTIGRLKWPVFMEIDETLVVPPTGLVLRGWFIDPFSTVQTIRIRSSEASRVLNQQDWIPIRRPDVVSAVGAQYGVTNEDCGFVIYARDIFSPDEVEPVS